VFPSPDSAKRCPNLSNAPGLEALMYASCVHALCPSRTELRTLAEQRDDARAGQLPTLLSASSW
jgi:hypothetical protein